MRQPCRTGPGILVLLLSLSLAAASPYIWVWRANETVAYEANAGYFLSENPGSHAVAMMEYGDPSQIWATIAAIRIDDQTDEAYALEYDDYQDITCEPDVVRVKEGDDHTSACVAMSETYKHMAFVDAHDYFPLYSRAPLTRIEDDWPLSRNLIEDPEEWWLHSEEVAIATQTAANSTDKLVHVAYWAEPCESPPDWQLTTVLSEADGTGEEWTYSYADQDEDYEFISIAAGGNSDLVHLLYVDYMVPTDRHMWKVSTDKGVLWSGSQRTTGAYYGCIAAVQCTVFVCWTKGNQIWYQLRDGSTWGEETKIDGKRGVTYDAANCFMFNHTTDNERWNNVMVASQGAYYELGEQYPAVSMRCGKWNYPSGWDWSQGEIWLPSHPSCELPFVGAYDPSGDAPVACCVWNDLRLAPDVAVQRSYGGWENSYLIPRRAIADNASGRLRRRPDGGLSHAGNVGPHAVSGPVTDSGVPAPMLVDVGVEPTLAIDGDSKRWVAFVREDTLWCYRADDGLAAVFCGSSSHRPGQPSIDIYPEKANGVYVASIVFATYDSASATSMIRFAKVDTVGVVLDTIESYAAARDSYPSCRVVRTDSIVCVWQHGDSVVASELFNYGPGSTGQPTTAWTTATVLDADGYHPMCELEGVYMHAVWVDTVEGGAEADSWLIRTATYDITGSGPMSGWQDGSDPSERDTREKDSPVYCKKGVTIWQEKVSGKWRIMGEVRGDTVTLATADSSLKFPHGQADSIAISPSINQVRVYMLCDEMTKTDTGEAFYDAESLNVSNATSDATESNNGFKLIRKSGSDSLFAAYEDADGAVMYAFSPDGAEWTRRQCTDDGQYPAVCEDGTGLRWVVYWNDGLGKVYAKFDSAGTFSERRELYDLSGDDCGPISVAGSHDGSNSCAYAAFRRIRDGFDDKLILVKFNGTDQASTELYEGDQYVHPCVGTEWDSGESKDDIHLCWENTNDNEVWYTKTSSPVDPTEAAPSYSWETDHNLSDSDDDSKDPSMHVGSDRVIIAWSEHATYDVVVARRDLGDTYNDFEDTVNLSESAVNSLYPVVYDGDSAIVMWEEQTSGTDYDIHCSVEFGSGFAIEDNSGKSRYPHCIFQNKASGDSGIPYIHTIWCEEPSTNYYEVGYTKYNIKEQGTGGGGGGQSGPGGPRIVPMLYACRPNPFSNRTQISYQFPKAGQVSLRVFDISGRTVRSLQNGHQEPGVYNVSWDGRDDRGRTLAHGVYFYQLDAPGFRDVKKAVVAR